MSTSIVFRNILDGWGAFALNNGICVIKQREGDPIDTVIHAKTFTSKNEHEIARWEAEVAEEVSQNSEIVMDTDPEIIGGYSFYAITSMCSYPEVGDVIKTGYHAVIETAETVDFLVIFTTVLVENALDDEPDIKTMLKNVVIGVLN